MRRGVGYVGLGNMGGALARRLLESGELVVYDQDRDALHRLAEAGAEVARDLADLAARCGVVFLCLPTSHHVERVLFGPGGLAAAASTGTIVVDQTTGDPVATRSMANRLGLLGIELVDAPVSGGAAGAEAGTIAIMVGAPPELYERVSIILTAISPNVFHAGDTGNGHVIKIVNNLMSCAQRLLTLEALSLASKNGVDPAVAVEILRAGGGRNAYLERMAPKVVHGDLQSGFTLGLALKDVSLAQDLADSSATPLPLGTATRELYASLVNELGAAAQVDEAAVSIDRAAGTHVVPVSPQA